MSDLPLVIKGADGKPIFLGKEDPKNPPVNPNVGQGSKMTCPVCKNEVDYLLGEDTFDGGVMGCETCWKPGKGGKREKQNTDPESEKDVFER